ncbi:unnamed protein product [Clonostachys rosea]|uniref:EKC/KEOPS complex subunit BUD32 n=1 Tax=Bionectria ochroleuca TaxID=29856 RepID=A0ABY6UMH6_BIOOC|nr:unnamed protein product [Clonostachys rosea]
MTLSDSESVRSTRFLPTTLGEVEDAERYENGGYHPVFLGDLYDGGRYRVVHKLGSGGFSVVWLAHDAALHTYVALKMVMADHSAEIEAKTTHSHQLLSPFQADERFATYLRFFHIEGPNGRHLCLVLPVLGPSLYELSHDRESRMSPWLARRVSLQVANALADLHSKGLVHGDFTPQNIVLRLQGVDFGAMSDADVYRLFGEPKIEPLETENGDAPGPEAPRSMVGKVDFFTSGRDMFSNDICLIDFDQSFVSGDPPEKLLGTPAEWLAPEVAAGRHAGQASDVWALGVTIMRVRQGDSLFARCDFSTPWHVLQIAMSAFGELPPSWGSLYFDYDGNPTRPQNPEAGEFKEGTAEHSLTEWVDSIWDHPGSLDETKGLPQPPGDQGYVPPPYPKDLASKFWKPGSVRVNGLYLGFYDDDVEQVVAGLPKISPHEASLLRDLLSKIFELEPSKRPTARELVDHPWFRYDHQAPLLASVEQ